MKFIGIALVVLGIIALVYGGISYSSDKTVLEVGSFKATAHEKKTFPLPPVAGALAVVAGVALIVVDRRRA